LIDNRAAVCLLIRAACEQSQISSPGGGVPPKLLAADRAICVRKSFTTLIGMYRSASQIGRKREAKRLVWSRRTDHSWAMEDVHTLLSPVQDDKIWRVKIVWPNRAVHYVGKFTSEQDAIDWIDAHPNLTKPEEFTD
jgi:hypothetical protein